MKNKSKLVLLLASIATLVSCGDNTVISQPSSSFKSNSSDYSSNSSTNSLKDSSVNSSSKKDETSSVSSSQPSSSNTTSSSSSKPSSSSSSVEEVKSFTITFKDENGATLDSRKWNKGQRPSYTYNKQNTSEYEYVFLGWSTSLNGTVLSEIPVVSQDAIYFAIISSTKKSYSIIFNSLGGSSINKITNTFGTLINEPTKPTKSGYKFVGWASDQAGKNMITFPYRLTKNETFYAIWNEKVDIKSYFKILVDTLKSDPNSYIPKTMQKTNTNNYVSQSDVTYNFDNFTNVSNIKYGGFGEQWHMVIDNIDQSQLFYNVISVGETVINTSVIAFNNFLDKNTDDTAEHEISDSTYKAKLNFNKGVLTYTLQYKTNMNVPVIGSVIPQIDMTYDIKTLIKTVRIQLNDNNAMKYSIDGDKYTFALQYGISSLSRKAYFELSKQNNSSVFGHIYEFIQLKGKDMVPSCADFYISEDYTSVVGNKASGITGFKGYINELYETSKGKLLGYKVRETFSKWGVEKTYNTLWFNLNDISNITSVKAIDNKGVDPHENNHDVYINNGTTQFTPTKNKVLTVATSRKYDIEMRKQYFYGLDEDNKVVEYETEIPMMFIQDDGSEKVENNYSTFKDDIKKDNQIAASVTLQDKYLDKIREDYSTIIDTFITHVDSITGDIITNYIGDAVNLV